MKQVNSFRFNLQELGGALGDMGRLLLLLIALVLVNNVSSTSAFLVDEHTILLHIRGCGRPVRWPIEIMRASPPLFSMLSIFSAKDSAFA